MLASIGLRNFHRSSEVVVGGALRLMIGWISVKSTDWLMIALRDRSGLESTPAGDDLTAVAPNQKLSRTYSSTQVGNQMDSTKLSQIITKHENETLESLCHGLGVNSILRGAIP